MSVIPSSSTHVAFVNLTAASNSAGNPSNQDPAEVATVTSVPMSSSPRAVHSGVQASVGSKPTAAPTGLAKPAPKPLLHRIGEARVSQGLSERTMCRRLNIDVKQLRVLEDPTTEVPLSMLLKIREALDVPFADLLVESDGLSSPIRDRAKILKIMKTAVTIKECVLPTRVARLAQMLNEQLVDLMPELADIGGWPEFGSRRGTDSIARFLACEVDTSQLRQE